MGQKRGREHSERQGEGIPGNNHCPESGREGGANQRYAERTSEHTSTEGSRGDQPIADIPHPEEAVGLEADTRSPPVNFYQQIRQFRLKGLTEVVASLAHGAWMTSVDLTYWRPSAGPHAVESATRQFGAAFRKRLALVTEISDSPELFSGISKEDKAIRFKAQMAQTFLTGLKPKKLRTNTALMAKLYKAESFDDIHTLALKAAKQLDRIGKPVVKRLNNNIQQSRTGHNGRDFRRSAYCESR
ncbi:hypothetical protein J8273_2255 [Carpediemonas membranifera]|uniref:Uncharacterized protein n=1 Tax=Carpediemonas membranifera TaxID=201153 RepID=A0A8J6B9D9_9EUKA|nr:hypothetical protein J8273_2255 [Carpediemonas membranifera]|eukprot:KAG9395909.1 hypothetical protein J8273_2255 [Carpediemonas membranifera]